MPRPGDAAVAPEPRQYGIFGAGGNLPAARCEDRGPVRFAPEESWGKVVAIDPLSGEIKWEHKVISPPWGGVMSTAGNLVFGGTTEGVIFALDAAPGSASGIFRERPVYASPDELSRERETVRFAGGRRRPDDVRFVSQERVSFFISPVKSEALKSAWTMGTSLHVTRVLCGVQEGTDAGVRVALVIAPRFPVPANARLFLRARFCRFWKRTAPAVTALQKMAGLDLTSFAGMMNGSSSGPVIAPGKPERSLLWKLIEGGQMPQGGKLTEAEKQTIRRILNRAASRRTRNRGRSARERPRITQKDREWWSFRVPVKPPFPLRRPITSAAIDSFISAKLERRGWKMQAEADRATLIRRGYLDLTGLPPTPAAVKAFVDDKSPNAWEKVIDGLLASPHYGEHWGRTGWTLPAIPIRAAMPATATVRSPGSIATM